VVSDVVIVQDLSVRESGPVDAPAIVFLHGVGNSGAMWRRHMQALSSYRCLAPDMPGHGESASIRWLSRADTADRVARIIEALPAGRAHVVGLSLGGSVALELLTRRADLLDHVIVDGCGALASLLAPLMKVGVGLVAPFIHSAVVGRLIARGIGVSDPAGVAALLEQFSHVDPGSFARAFADAQEVRVSEALIRAQNRTLLVAGERELAHVRRSNRQLGESMPHAESRMMPGEGHGWLGRASDVHVAMVRAWIEDQALPMELAPEAPA
jgi:pimeloyl-ACP methyl ester carboxylesterase